MKKIALSALVAMLLLFSACAEKTTDITIKAELQEALQSYNFAEVSESFVENEDGSMVYTITNSTISTMKEDTANKLANNVERFVEGIEGQNPEIVIDIAFSEDATVLEGTVTDAFGAANGMVFLIVPSYPDVLIAQILAGIDPTGITLKMTDAVTAEVFEQEIPF